MLLFSSEGKPPHHPCVAVGCAKAASCQRTNLQQHAAWVCVGSGNCRCAGHRTSCESLGAGVRSCDLLWSSQAVHASSLGLCFTVFHSLLWKKNQLFSPQRWCHRRQWCWRKNSTSLVQIVWNTLDGNNSCIHFFQSQQKPRSLCAFPAWFCIIEPRKSQSWSSGLPTAFQEVMTCSSSHSSLLPPSAPTFFPHTVSGFATEHAEMRGCWYSGVLVFFCGVWCWMEAAALFRIW